jgi:hypothetical protein
VYLLTGSLVGNGFLAMQNYYMSKFKSSEVSKFVGGFI